jgi:hypothetical protein
MSGTNFQTASIKIFVYFLVISLYSRCVTFYVLMQLNVVDWIGLAQDRYRWRALVNSGMNLQVP